MPKVKVVVTHEEFAEIDLGMPEKMFAEMLAVYIKDGTGNWSLSDAGADWAAVKIQVGEEVVEL
jgi:hypothetical protein